MLAGRASGEILAHFHMFYKFSSFSILSMQNNMKLLMSSSLSLANFVARPASQLSCEPPATHILAPKVSPGGRAKRYGAQFANLRSV